MNGYIYAMESDGLVKIGFSADPAVRRAQVQTLEKAPVRLALQVPVLDMAGCEFAAHQKLKANRVRGEWFNVSIEEAIECLTWAANNPASPADRSGTLVGLRLLPAELDLLDQWADKLGGRKAAIIAGLMALGAKAENQPSNAELIDMLKARMK